MRLIDADRIKSKMNKAALGGHLHYYVCGVIDDAPTIDAELVRHGHWIFKGRNELVPTGEFGVAEGHHVHLSSGETFKPDKMGILVLKKHKKVIKPFCSECGDYGDDASYATPYCPNCGAKMDGEIK